jgi:lysophospholipase L1-like esterase
VLAQSGATDVIVAYGVTDLAFFTIGGNPADAVTAEELIAGLRQLIVRGHAQQLRVHGATLIPNEESTFVGFYTPENEAARQAINHWIRTSGAFDGVVDFDAAVRDPGHPSRLLPAYASDDFTHPNDAGYAAMAASIRLDLFR